MISACFHYSSLTIFARQVWTNCPWTTRNIFLNWYLVIALIIYNIKLWHVNFASNTQRGTLKYFQINFILWSKYVAEMLFFLLSTWNIACIGMSTPTQTRSKSTTNIIVVFVDVHVYHSVQGRFLCSVVVIYCVAQITRILSFLWRHYFGNVSLVANWHYQR